MCNESKTITQVFKNISLLTTKEEVKSDLNGNSSTEIYVTKLRSLVPDVTLQDTFNVFFLTLSQS